MAEEIRLLPLGTGWSFAEELYYTNLLLMVGERFIFVDCPPYLFRMLREHRERLGDERLRAESYGEVIITHNHEDHVAGVEELGYLSVRGRMPRPRLYGLPATLEALWEGSLRAGLSLRVDAAGRPLPLGMEDYFEPVPIGERNDMGGFILETRKTFHTPETIALKFDFGGGRKLGYSCDTGFVPDLIDWLSECDFIIHEVNFRPDVPFHTPLDRLKELPEDLQRKIHLVHYSDDFRDHDPGAMRFLEQGRVYRLFEGDGG